MANNCEKMITKRKWYDKDIETSLLGFGCMRFTTKDGEIEEEKAMALIDKAYKAGVNYFDTALPYTNRKNEPFVGKALKRYPRDSFYLATKFSLGCFNTKEEAVQTIDKQLESLQTDYIDFYLIHALNKDSFKKFKDWDLMKEVIKWKEMGKILHIGFSFHDSYEVFKEILDYFDWEFVQLQLNYMDTEIQQGIQGYKDLEERKIPVVVMEPVKGGRLASFNPSISKDFKDYSDASLSSWALRWVGTLPGVKVILSGMNEDEQVVDNINTFTDFKPLNEEELQLVENVKTKLINTNKVGCTNCKYCMPCPMGVAIPNILRMYNDYAMYMNEASTKWNYNQLVKENKDISKCIECNACTSKCPQCINPPEVFKEMLDEMRFLK